jgi:methylenetetrahydrofolate reductase (NADPH)
VSADSAVGVADSSVIPPVFTTFFRDSTLLSGEGGLFPAERGAHFEVSDPLPANIGIVSARRGNKDSKFSVQRTGGTESTTMHIQDILAAHKTTFSFEFMPPKTEEAAEQLYEAIADLEPLRPSFVSVTYGAGGSTRQHTHDIVVRLKEETTCDPIPHLTCVCHQEEEIRSILELYAESGISNILALSGDPPRKMKNYDRSQDAFRYAADLVRYIQKFNESGAHPDKRGFGIGVAGFPEGHPATPNRLKEIDFLKAKVDAGADYIVTQLFFDNHDFYDFR